MSTPFVAPRAGPEAAHGDRSSSVRAPQARTRTLRLVEESGDGVAWSPISKTAASDVPVPTSPGPSPEVIERVRASRAQQGLSLGVQDQALIAALRKTLQPTAHARGGRRSTY